MPETIRIREGEGFDLAAVESYLWAHLEDLPEGELEDSEFPSGASNLTYVLTIADWEGVLRLPLFASLLARRFTPCQHAPALAGLRLSARPLRGLVS